MPLSLPPLQSKTQLRDRFVANLLAITGDTRLLWTPKPTDTTTSTDESLNGRTLTADATMASQLTALGNGYARTFNGSTNYLTTPDQANLSFGDGTTDSSFSVVALANVTNTANSRACLTKYTGTDREWFFQITAADLLQLGIIDESVPVGANRDSNGAITMGSWRLFGATYDVTVGSGATAANGIALYQDGLAIASTATNNGTYVAMEGKAAAVEVGSVSTHTDSFFEGGMALIVLCLGALTASQHWALKKAVNAHFGLSL